MKGRIGIYISENKTKAQSPEAKLSEKLEKDEHIKTKIISRKET